jgi:hypothetical protein
VGCIGPRQAIVVATRLACPNLPPKTPMPHLALPLQMLYALSSLGLLDITGEGVKSKDHGCQLAEAPCRDFRTQPLVT